MVGLVVPIVSERLPVSGCCSWFPDLECWSFPLGCLGSGEVILLLLLLLLLLVLSFSEKQAKVHCIISIKLLSQPLDLLCCFPS